MYVTKTGSVVILQYVDMLQRIWNELDYRVDVCIITNSAHIEHLLGMKQKLVVLLYYSMLTCYRQFGTNWIIVMMFV
jgi:hypothetical protein